MVKINKFDLQTSEERVQYVKENVNLSALSQKDVEWWANYILFFGKNKKDKKSSQIQIQTKHNTWSQKDCLSLEELLENPHFDETNFSTTRYKIPKPNFNREENSDIPNISELFTAIDKISDLIDSNSLEGKKLYHYKHLLIDLRNQQYMLKDHFKPAVGTLYQKTPQFHLPDTYYEMNYPILPCGILGNSNDFGFKFPFHNGRDFESYNLEDKITTLKNKGKRFLNFCDPRHIYILILNYYDLESQAAKSSDSLLSNLLLTLDFYIEKANFTPKQKLIIEAKKNNLNNEQIQKLLKEKLGFTHQQNYTSTIWNKCCRAIAKAANEHFDEWCCKDYDKAWKKCNCCGEIKLLGTRNFMRKISSPDGFGNKCKECEKKKRPKKNS